MSKSISAIETSLLNIPKIGQARNVNIRGEQGAAFILQLVDSSGKFYNFKTNTFTETSHTPQNLLRGAISGSSFTRRINFPNVASTTTYNIIVVADPTTDTTIAGGIGALNVNLKQVADTTITLAYNTANTSNYTSSPPAANLATALSSAKKKFTFINDEKTISNATGSGNNNGLKITRKPVDTDLVFRMETTLDGTTSSSKTLVADSVTDLVVGMVLVSGPNLSGTPVVTAIDKVTKTVTLSAAQTLNSDGAALKFDAQGPKMIFKTIGIGIGQFTCEARVPKDGAVSTTVAADGGGTEVTDGSSANMTVASTHGIAKTSTVTGDGISSGVTVLTVPNTTQLTLSSAQNLSTLPGSGVGTLVKFGGFFTKIDLTTKFFIQKAGTTDRTLTLLLDNFITPGEES
jgi:hypothetical protein